MADNQLFPVYDLPQIPNTDAEDEIYRESVFFDFETGDFRRDGANRMTVASGRDAWIQWCEKVLRTERLTCLAYSEDIGTEFEEMQDLADRESVQSDIERTITEALMVHPATEYVAGFDFEDDGDGAICTFVVKGYPWEESKALSIRF